MSLEYLDQFIMNYLNYPTADYRVDHYLPFIQKSLLKIPKYSKHESMKPYSVEQIY